MQQDVFGGEKREDFVHTEREAVVGLSSLLSPFLCRRLSLLEIPEPKNWHGHLGPKQNWIFQVVKFWRWNDLFLWINKQAVPFNWRLNCILLGRLTYEWVDSWNITFRKKDGRMGDWKKKPLTYTYINAMWTLIKKDKDGHLFRSSVTKRSKKKTSSLQIPLLFFWKKAATEKPRAL